MLKRDKGFVIERRYIAADDLRAVTDDGVPKIAGHAAVFNQLSEDLGGFREQIKPGCFARTIQQADIKALWNHDTNIVLGRNRSATLKLIEDDKGLAIEVTPPDWASGYMETIERGDVNQMSFGFRTVADEWVHNEGEISMRTLVEVELFDVSPVTFPAYPQTDVNVRGLLGEVGIDVTALNGLIFRSDRGLDLTDSDKDLIRSSIDVLQSYLPSEPAASPLAIPLSIMQRRLELAERS